MERKGEIKKADCPPGLAEPYPGKKSRNNPKGTVLTKSEFTDKSVETWVRHFENSDEYHKTIFSNKVGYLKTYLKPLKVGYSDVKEKLMAAESKLAQESEEEILTQSQNLLNSEMDVDLEGKNDFEDCVEDVPRWEREKEVNKVLSLTDLEIFEGNNEIKDYVKQTHKYKERERSFYLSKSDQELFELYDKLSPGIKRHKEFKQRYEQYVENYMEENFAQSSSQEILLKLSQTPTAVQSSEVFKERLCHLSFQDRSHKLLMKNIKETITELMKTPEGRKQAKLFIAGVSHPVFGDPGLDLNERTRKEVKEIKENLLKGKESTLKEVEKEKRTEFPKTVEDLARNHWMENTIPEPAKHTGKAIEVEGETVPTRYQDKTDRECYENFKEECQEPVKIEMAKSGQKLFEKLTGRADTADKQKRLDYAQHLSERCVL
jgi:hypothetical protein